MHHGTSPLFALLAHFRPPPPLTRSSCSLAPWPLPLPLPPPPPKKNNLANTFAQVRFSELFAHYDHDASGHLDPQELGRLVADLLGPQAAGPADVAYFVAMLDLDGGWGGARGGARSGAVDGGGGGRGAGWWMVGGGVRGGGRRAMHKDLGGGWDGRAGVVVKW